MIVGVSGYRNVGTNLIRTRVHREEIERMHPSETEHFNHKFHMVVHNRGTREEFIQCVEELIVDTLL